VCAAIITNAAKREWINIKENKKEKEKEQQQRRLRLKKNSF
jgi:hypothetical protein